MPTNVQLPSPDLTPWHMFQSADIVVKSVIVALLIASVVTWTILLAKWLQLSLANRPLRALRGVANTETSLDAFGARQGADMGPVGLLLASARTELELSDDLPADGIKARIALR